MTENAIFSFVVDVYKQGIISKINFEENWLKDVKMQQGFVSIADIEVAMDALRSAVKGGKHE